MNENLDIQIIAIIFSENPLLFLLVFLPTFGLCIFLAYKYLRNPGKYKWFEVLAKALGAIGLVYILYSGINEWKNTIEERIHSLENRID